MPAIFDKIRKRGRVSDDEMWGTFNMGLGMVLVVDPKDVPEVALTVGEVVAAALGGLSLVLVLVGVLVAG